MADVTPVTLLIGLAGAGKTTLLQGLLRQPEAAGIAVVAAQPEPPMWWNGGCPCCTPRDDVARALRALLPRARRDEVRRVVVETAGMADPGPILATLLSDMVAASAYRLDTIVTVVDAAQGSATLDAHDRAVRQVAAADRIVLSQVGPDGAAALRDRLRRLNPAAPIIDAHCDSAAVFGPGPLDPVGKTPDLTAWLDTAAFADRHGAAPQSHASIDAFCLTIDQPLAWPGVSAWLERLILRHGDALLRMKGILRVRGNDRPVLIHSVRHQLHPPVELPAWPRGDTRNTRVMFITDGLSRAAVAAEMPALPVG